LNPPKHNPYSLQTIGLLLGSGLAGLLAALLLVMVTLSPPMDDVRLLFLFMSVTGGLSVFAAYVLYRRGMSRWFRSLRWVLLAITVLTVALVFVNVFVTAQLMFISYHDLILTTALLLFAGVVAVIAIYFISAAWIERIHELGWATQQVGRGDLTIRLGEQGKDELAQLAALFNQMTGELQAVDEQKQQLEQTRRDLVAWVSHDLRTPLAAIRAMNESILDGVVDDPQTITRYHHTIQREVNHLSHLIDDLFELAQLDAGHPHLTLETASLRDLVSDTLGSLSAQAAQKGITLTGDVEAGMDLIRMAPDKIQRVLNNLLDNALRHTASGGQVKLQARRAGKQAEIRVHNTGQPIATTDLPHIFNRFYRGEPARTQAGNGYRGTGLGLAIVRGFVEAHGGSIHVENTPDGTSFVFTLPL